MDFFFLGGALASACWSVSAAGFASSGFFLSFAGALPFLASAALCLASFLASFFSCFVSLLCSLASFFASCFFCTRYLLLSFGDIWLSFSFSAASAVAFAAAAAA